MQSEEKIRKEVERLIEWKSAGRLTEHGQNRLDTLLEVLEWPPELVAKVMIHA